MNKHSYINRKKLFEAYEKSKRKKLFKECLTEDIINIMKSPDYNKYIEEVKELSKEGYLVWYDTSIGEELYLVWSKENGFLRYISAEQIKPKSTREKLHNFQENKKYHKSIQPLLRETQ